MNTSQAYIAIAIASLVVVVLIAFVIRRNRQENRLSPLASLAFGFILAGILFGENRFIGYGLMAGGVILAVVDIFRSPRMKHK